MDEMFANGDGSDSWCKTKLRVPLELYPTKAYEAPVCGSYKCYQSRLGSINPDFDASTGAYCDFTDPLNKGTHFACM